MTIRGDFQGMHKYVGKKKEDRTALKIENWRTNLWIAPYFLNLLSLLNYS